MWLSLYQTTTRETEQCTKTVYNSWGELYTSPDQCLQHDCGNYVVCGFVYMYCTKHAAEGFLWSILLRKLPQVLAKLPLNFNSSLANTWVDFLSKIGLCKLGGVGVGGVGGQSWEGWCSGAVCRRQDLSHRLVLYIPSNMLCFYVIGYIKFWRTSTDSLNDIPHGCIPGSCCWSNPQGYRSHYDNGTRTQQNINNVYKHDKSCRYHFVYAPSQWETTLHCNVVSHWLGTYVLCISWN